MTPTADPVDLLEELRLRRWARENYCYAEARQVSWHPIVHEEMRLRDAEGLSESDIRMLAEDEPLAPPTDSTVLSDSPDAEVTTEAADTTDRKLPLMVGPIVPLAPGIPGLHGPHEITPPHTRVAEPAEATELHFG